ncbi:MAG: radical SAM protein [Elusimicrobiales bacterium]
MKNIQRIAIELTHRCNLSCKFCYLKESKYFKKSEITIEKLKKFVDYFKDKTHFYLTGGEPLLSGHLIEISKYIKSKNHILGINTNGILFDSKTAKEIAFINPEYVIFSVFADNKTYPLLSGSDRNHFKKILKNIDYFNSIKFNNTESIIGCVITPENVENLHRIYKISSEIKADRFLIEHLQFYRNIEAKNNDRSLFGDLIMKRLDNIDFPCEKLIKQISLILKEKNGPSFDIRPAISVKGIKKYYSILKSKEPIFCDYKDSIIVEPDGDIRLCFLYSKKIGTIFDFKISEIKKIKMEKLKNLPRTCYRCCHRFKISRLREKS